MSMSLWGVLLEESSRHSIPQPFKAVSLLNTLDKSVYINTPGYVAEFFHPQNISPWRQILFSDTLWCHWYLLCPPRSLCYYSVLIHEPISFSKSQAYILSLSSTLARSSGKDTPEEENASLRWTRIHFCIILQHTHMNVHFLVVL